MDQLPDSGQAGALSQGEITRAMIAAGADALWLCSEHDGDYVRYPRSLCADLARLVLVAATLRATNAAATVRESAAS